MNETVATAAGFTLWAVIHSFLAAKRVKTWVRRRIGAAAFRFYRMGFVIFAVASLAPLAALVIGSPGAVLYAVASPWRYLMMGVQALGAAIVIRTVIITGAADFLGVPGAVGKDGGKLQTGGPYGYVRHPMYTAGIAVMWLSPVMRANILVLFILMTAYFLTGSIHEELLLLDEYGDDYADYRRRVPRFIPRSLKPFRPRGSRPDDGPVGKP